MPMVSKRQLELESRVRVQLDEISRSRSEARQRVERARMLLAFAEGQNISAIARDLHTTRPRVLRTIDKAREAGAVAALEDFRGERGRPATITEEARAWVVSVACQRPKELGYPHELWTRQLLARHLRERCEAAGHSSLKRVNPGTVTKILLRHRLKPHKVRYYVENRDPEFETKMAQVLHVYREVRLLREAGAGADAPVTAFLVYDEKPGIQAIGCKGGELPPVPLKHPSLTRDYEYVRHGTMTLMAGIDLLTGTIFPQVVDRHRSREFIAWLKTVHDSYPPEWTLRVVLDNHSAHTSRETRAFLATLPNRFEFVFTPKHGSWLNLAENLFAKLAHTVLREIRVTGKDELKERLLQMLALLNSDPVPPKWQWGLDDLAVR
jgi:transposase/DNA-binding MarR family transcriptional regulator